MTEGRREILRICVALGEVFDGLGTWRFGLSLAQQQTSQLSPARASRTVPIGRSKISLVGVLFLVPVDLFVSYGFISNIGLFTQVGVLLIIFFVFSLGVAIP